MAADGVGAWDHHFRRQLGGRGGTGGLRGSASPTSFRFRIEDDMALEKSKTCSKLWQSCDELSGGMDAGQYQDYVLTLLLAEAGSA
jgi:hypothetical protein